jgi:hypothetical protein
MRLSAAHQQRRVDVIAALHHPIDEYCAGSLGKRFELDQFGLERAPRIVRIDGDDNCTLRLG